jgi:hypothetical protein
LVVWRPFSEILTQESQKGYVIPYITRACAHIWIVSYDVNKDGVKVTALTLTKSAYQLGFTSLLKLYCAHLLVLSARWLDNRHPASANRRICHTD